MSLIIYIKILTPVIYIGVVYMYKVQENTPSPASFPTEEKLYVAVWATLVLGMMYMIQVRKL